MGEEEQTIMTTTSKIDEIDKNLELEKFAQDVAETVVTNMEKHGTFAGAISNQMSASAGYQQQDMTIQEQQETFSSSKVSETNQIQQVTQDQNTKSNHVNGMFKAKPIHTMKGDHGEKMSKRKQHEELKLQEYEERKKAEELERIQKNEELKRQRLEEHRRKNEEKDLEMQSQKMEEEERLKKESENRRIE